MRTKNKTAHRILNRVHGFPRDREGKEFLKFAAWHHSRFHDQIIFREQARRLIAAYRFYLSMEVSEIRFGEK